MRLIWKKYDSKFDPIIAAVGAWFVVCGLYGVVLLGRAFRHLAVWALAAVPFLLAVMGVLILVREYQLWNMRS